MNSRTLFRDLPDLMNVKQMQSALKIGRTLAYRLLKENQIEHFYVGNSIRIPKSSLTKYVYISVRSHAKMESNDEQGLVCHKEGEEHDRLC